MDPKVASTSNAILQKENSEENEQRKKKRGAIRFNIWPTRRIAVQAYICITLNIRSTFRFVGAFSSFGGILWITYFVCAILVGVPVVTAEMALAHYINKDIIQVWKMCPIARGIFWNCLISTFTYVVFSYLFIIFLMIYSTYGYPSPYLDLSNCFVTKNESIGKCGNSWTYLESEYLTWHEFHKELVTNTTLVDYPWLPYVYLTLTSILILLINCRGIRSLAKFTIIFVLLPFLCIVIFAILTLTLPKSVKHIAGCWQLNWHNIWNISVWIESFIHVINGFAIGTLCISFVSIHSDYNDDIMVDVTIMFLAIFFNTLLTAIGILGLRGVISGETEYMLKNVPFNDDMIVLLQTFRGLQFIPSTKWYYKFLLFTYLLVSAFGVQCLMVASVVDSVVSLCPLFQTNPFYVTTGVCFIFFSFAALMIISEIPRLPSLDSSFMIVGLLQSVTIFWIYSYQRMSADFHFLMGYKPSLFYQFTWVISPIIFMIAISLKIFLQESVDLFINNSLIMLVLHSIVYFLCAIIESYRLWKKQHKSNIFQHDKNWGPLDPLLKQSREIFKSRIITKEHIYRQKLYKKQLIKPYDITNQNIVQLL